MSDKQVGQYIRLLCYQHQSKDGKMLKSDMLGITKKVDPVIWSKFVQDENGLYYNARLFDEINNRKAYIETQKNKVKSRWDKKKNDTKVIPNEYNGNTVVIPARKEKEIALDNSLSIKSSKVFKPPTLEDIQAYCLERNNNLNAKAFYDYFTVSGWIDGKGNPVKNWKQKIITWENHQTKPADKRQTFEPDWLDDYIKEIGKLEG